MLPGVIGVLQANEVLKILVGYGEPLIGRILTFDAQSSEFGQLRLRRDPMCITCGSGKPAPVPSEPVAEPAPVAEPSLT